MSYKIDQVSVVVIGSFNPSILTPQFLETKCGLTTSCKARIAAESPVYMDIRYDRLKFQAALDRFQAKEEGLSALAKTCIPRIVQKYLDVLAYTPLQAAGINFHVEPDRNGLSRLNLSKVDDWSHALSFMGELPSEVVATVAWAKTGQKETLKEVKLLWNIEPDIVAREILTFNGDSTCTSQFNFEVGRLDKDRTRQTRVLSCTEQLASDHNRLIDAMEAAA